jgi:hypothetical protein
MGEPQMQHDPVALGRGSAPGQKIYNLRWRAVPRADEAKSRLEFARENGGSIPECVVFFPYRVMDCEVSESSHGDTRKIGRDAAPQSLE